MRDYEHDPELDPAPRTTFYHDRSQSIISSNTSPDIPYNLTINPYRGCEHGCIYCYARPTHEYLGLSSGLDFETKVFVKHDAPELLRKHFAGGKWDPQPIAMAGVTDCYQPVERKLQITRKCLEVFAEFRNPLWITTKNHLVTRGNRSVLLKGKRVCIKDGPWYWGGFRLSRMVLLMRISAASWARCVGIWRCSSAAMPTWSSNCARP